MNLNESTFDFIDCPTTRNCIINGCWALNKTNLWGWLRDYEVNPSCGFMFANEPELYVIENMMENKHAPHKVSHSGASFGFTMRVLHYISLEGFENYKHKYLENNKKREQLQQSQTNGNE